MPEHEYTEILNKGALLHWEGYNSKAVISSHGEIAYNKQKIGPLQVNLHFTAHGNRSTHGKVSSIIYMGSSDFFSEPQKTSNIDQHNLVWYEKDTPQEIEECLEHGFDVVTITPHREVTLGKILSVLYGFNRYDDVYGLFCRNASGKDEVKKMSKKFQNQIKNFAFKK